MELDEQEDGGSPATENETVLKSDEMQPEQAADVQDRVDKQQTNNANLNTARDVGTGDGVDTSADDAMETGTSDGIEPSAVGDAGINPNDSLDDTESKSTVDPIPDDKQTESDLAPLEQPVAQSTNKNSDVEIEVEHFASDAVDCDLGEGLQVNVAAALTDSPDMESAAVMASSGGTEEENLSQSQAAAAKPEAAATTTTQQEKLEQQVLRIFQAKQKQMAPTDTVESSQPEVIPDTSSAASPEAAVARDDDESGSGLPDSVFDEDCGIEEARATHFISDEDDLDVSEILDDLPEADVIFDIDESSSGEEDDVIVHNGGSDNSNNNNGAYQLLSGSSDEDEEGLVGAIEEEIDLEAISDGEETSYEEGEGELVDSNDDLSITLDEESLDVDDDENMAAEDECLPCEGENVVAGEVDDDGGAGDDEEVLEEEAAPANPSVLNQDGSGDVMIQDEDDNSDGDGDDEDEGEDDDNDDEVVSVEAGDNNRRETISDEENDGEEHWSEVEIYDSEEGKDDDEEEEEEEEVGSDKDSSLSSNTNQHNNPNNSILVIDSSSDEGEVVEFDSGEELDDGDEDEDDDEEDEDDSDIVDLDESELGEVKNISVGDDSIEIQDLDQSNQSIQEIFADEQSVSDKVRSDSPAQEEEVVVFDRDDHEIEAAETVAREKGATTFWQNGAETEEYLNQNSRDKTKDDCDVTSTTLRKSVQLDVYNSTVTSMDSKDDDDDMDFEVLEGDTSQDNTVAGETSVENVVISALVTTEDSADNIQTDDTVTIDGDTTQENTAAEETSVENMVISALVTTEDDTVDGGDIGGFECETNETVIQSDADLTSTDDYDSHVPSQSTGGVRNKTMCSSEYDTTHDSSVTLYQDTSFASTLGEGDDSLMSDDSGDGRHTPFTRVNSSMQIAFSQNPSLASSPDGRFSETPASPISGDDVTLGDFDGTSSDATSLHDNKRKRKSSKRPLNPLAEHRSWCPWVKCIASIHGHCEKENQAVGWQVLLQLLLQDSSANKKNQNGTRSIKTSSAQAVERRMRGLFDGWTSSRITVTTP